MRWIPWVALADALENNSLPADKVSPSNKTRLLETTQWSRHLLLIFHLLKPDYVTFTEQWQLQLQVNDDIMPMLVLATVNAKLMVLAKC